MYLPTLTLVIVQCVISSSSGSTVVPGLTRMETRMEKKLELPQDVPIIFPDYDIPGDSDYTEYDTEADAFLNDIDELTADELTILSEAKSLEEIAALYNVSLPTDGPTKPTIGLRSGAARAIIKAEPAGCLPALTHVELDLPVEEDVIFAPSCTRLHRCGGCCVGNILSCQPNSVEEVELHILKIARSKADGPRLGGTRRNRPRRRRRSADYITIRQTNHTSCKCQCIQKEEDCDPRIHIYQKSSCACLCQNKDEQRKCHKMSETHLWDSEKCQCICRDKHECSSGQYFSHTNCRCEQSVTGAGRSGLVRRPVNDYVRSKYDTIIINRRISFPDSRVVRGGNGFRGL